MINKISKTYFLFFIIFIIPNQFLSQIKIEWKLDSKMENANISIYNEGKEDILIPLDKKSLLPYYTDNYNISETDWIDNYPFFGLTLNIFDKIDNKNIETHLSSPYFDPLKFDDLKRKKDSIKKAIDLKINSWKIENNIEDLRKAKINYYIMNNVLLLKSKEKIEFSIPFNLWNIINQYNGQLQGIYVLDKEKKNSAFLSIRIDKSIYKYITEKQKRKLKKYKLFSGSLESNKIELNLKQ